MAKLRNFGNCPAFFANFLAGTYVSRAGVGKNRGALT
jgi:hypothetical protein